MLKPHEDGSEINRKSKAGINSFLSVRNMNREEAENFVYQSYLRAEKHQDYNEKDAAKRRPDLTREIIRKKAGTPAAVITGSKGKGSAANMISQILQTKYKVGLMTSPHLTRFNERFKINGADISDEDFVKYMSLIRPEIEQIGRTIPENVCISPMGIQADLALTYFRANHTDFNVFECGKGAKYDDVNNVVHEYAVINSIFLEHTRELGSTVEAIAEDKSHVITGGQKCVYTAAQKPSVLKVIEDRAAEFGTPLKVYGRDFRADNIRYSNAGMCFDAVIENAVFRDISIPLMGEHQARNCALAMALSLDALGGFRTEDVKQRLLALNWPGRMEVIHEKPFMMLDACINAASCGNVKDVMRHLNIEKAAVIIGIPDDKDYAGVIREMNPAAERIILTKSQNPHYIFTDAQCKKMLEYGIATVFTDSVSEAIEQAKTTGKPIIILGTTSLVSEVKQLQLSDRL